MNARHEAPFDWAEANQQWLVAAIAALRERIAAGGDAASGVLVAPPGFTPALLRCERIFGLSPFESELLLLAAGLELDQGLRAAIAQPRVTFGQALGWLVQPHWDALSPAAPLRHWLLLEPEAGAPLTDAPLRLDERVLHFITGVAAVDTQLLGVARYVERRAASAAPALAARIAAALADDGERGTLAVLQHDGADAGALRDLALAVAAQAQRPALWIAAADLPANAAELALAARRIDRESALAGALPLLAVDGGDAPALGLAALLSGSLLWLGPATPRHAALTPARRVLRFDVPAAAGTAVDHDDPEVATALQRAAAQFQLGPLALDGLLERLAQRPPAERAAAVWPAAREAARGGLDALAQRIDSRASFDDLVLPNAQRTALHDIVRQLQHRERVYRDWGFAGTQARGQGLTALFAGESGTGKTLAAEVVAGAIGLDLYRVDLATLVSKYIGETEKNLKRLFDAAESSGAVLLFDEADALFGKRSEVKDSHDRYANIEVAYLLQRIEAYRGLAVLTTNMKSALDRAFLRRIRFVVTFPFPDAAAREQIWRRQFPPQAPVGALDFAALARWHVAGGHIRNIALDAAFKAADGSGRIEQATLVEAARAEFAKLERSFHEAAGGPP